MYDIVLFDLDGTLTDPQEGITNCVKYALESFGISEDDMFVLRKFIGPPLVDSFMQFYGFSREKAEIAVAKYRERFSDVGIFENRLIDGAKELLAYLKENNIKIALATSKPFVFAEKIIDKYDIADYFDYVVGAELDGTRNYKNEVIDEVLRQAKTEDLSSAVMIGDRKQDILGAKKCGIASFGVRCGYAEPGELEQAGADCIFDNLYDLKEFFR